MTTIVYLAGPINGCTDEECVDWRQHIKNTWPQMHNTRPELSMPRPKLFQFMDPMKRDYRDIEGDCYREIVDLDKRDIRCSMVMLVNYVKPSVGTSMEIFYAWTLGTPIVIVAKPETKISPWLRYHSTAIVHSFEEARKKIEFFAHG